MAFQALGHAKDRRGDLVLAFAHCFEQAPVVADRRIAVGMLKISSSACICVIAFSYLRKVTCWRL